MNPRLALLTLCQGLLMVNNVTFIAINGLVGLALAPVAAAWSSLTIAQVADAAGAKLGIDASTVAG